MTILWWGFATNALAQSARLAAALGAAAADPPALVRRDFTLRRDECRGAADACRRAGADGGDAEGSASCSVGDDYRRRPRGAVRRAACRRAAGDGDLLLRCDTPAARPAQPHGLDLSRSFARSWAARDLKLDLVGRGLLLGFLPLPLALAPLGLASAARRAHSHPLLRALIAAWLLVCLVFLAADFGLGLLVRYVYFATPLICLALARCSRHSPGVAGGWSRWRWCCWSPGAGWRSGSRGCWCGSSLRCCR